MCEQFVARAAEPFRLDELWPFAERLERFGIAGFGWGAAWLGADGASVPPRCPSLPADDPAQDPIGADRDNVALVHLRRPSRLSTIGIADTQPFDDPAGRYAFSHNGDFERHTDLRAGFRADGRIHGRADTEVGARWLEDAWDPVADRPRLLETLHDTFRRSRRTWRSCPETARSGTTPAIATTPSSRSASAGSPSPRPGCTRSIARSSVSSHRARQDVASSAPLRHVTLGPDGRPTTVNFGDSTVGTREHWG